MPSVPRSRTLRRLPVATAAALTVALALPAVGSAASLRTWVSGVGDDANPCSRTAPCKTFAGAISKTEAGGEINVLDPGGFGSVTITKSITIDAGGMLGGIQHQGSTGIVVSAPSSADVTLRGLTVHGGGEVGPTWTCTGSGAYGVRVVSAGSVRIEDSTFSNAGKAAVLVAPSSGAPSVVLDGVAIRNGCEAGIDVAPTGTASAAVTVRDTTISNMGVGLRVADGGRAWLSGSTLTGNYVGLQTLGTGTIAEYFATNQIHGNGTDGAATSVIGGPVEGPVGPQGPVGATGAVGATGPVGPAAATTNAGESPAETGKPAASATCKVPKLTGLTQAAASKRLKSAGCAVGKVTRKPAAKKRVGRVISQSRKAGSKVAKGTKVNLTVGRAR